jgi:hypothetical protein
MREDRERHHFVLIKRTLILADIINILGLDFPMKKNPWYFMISKLESMNLT